MTTFINAIIWYSIFRMVVFSGINGNPYLLLFPILLSYYVIVVQGIFITKVNGE